VILVDANRNGRRLFLDRARLDHAFGLQVTASHGEGDKAAGDRSRARAAIGLDHIAIDGDRVLAQRLQVDHRAQRAPDQALDFLRPARLLARRRLPAAPRMRRARQHAVFARHPALALALQPARHALFPARRTQHMRMAELGEA